MFNRPTRLTPLQADPAFETIKDKLDTRIDTIKKYTGDFGHIVNKTPDGIFKPKTTEELQTFLSLATKHYIKLTIRGGANSAFGQAQVKRGILIDLCELQLPFEFNNEDAITIPAACTWFDLIEKTKPFNKTTPVTIDNLKLTIGGTLSFGALGGTSYRVGSGCDNVSELSVMTLDGKIQTCSQHLNEALYNAVLAGHGQFGIILTATIPVIPAKKNTNTHFLSYHDPLSFFHDQKLLYETQAVDHLKGSVKRHEETKAWTYVIEATNYFDDKESETSLNQIAKLKPIAHTEDKMPYFNFINQVTQFVELLKKADKYDKPHPWYNILLPETAVQTHLHDILNGEHLTGSEPIIVYPMNSAHFHQPLFIKPTSETFYLVGVLYNTSFLANDDSPYDVLTQNKCFYESAKYQGGCRYPVDAIQFTPYDWEKHYGEKWPMVVNLKEKFDPHHLLSSTFEIVAPEYNLQLSPS